MSKISQSIVLITILFFGNSEIFSKARKASLKKSRSIKKKKLGKKKKKRSTRRKKGKKGRRGAPSLKRETRPPTRLVQAQSLPLVQPQISETDIALQKAVVAQKEKEIAIEKERKQREEQERLGKVATKIQAAYRGYREREKLKKEAEENFKKIGDAIEDMLNVVKAYGYRGPTGDPTKAQKYSDAFDSKKVQLWNEIKDLYNKSNFPERAKEFLDSLGQFIKDVESELSAVKEEKDVLEAVCAICQENLKDILPSEELEDLSPREKYGEIVQLKCKHQFHRKCVEEWLKTSLTCPLCKLKIILMPDRQRLEHFISLLKGFGWQSDRAKERLEEFLRSESMIGIFKAAGVPYGERIKFILKSIFPQN